MAITFVHDNDHETDDYSMRLERRRGRRVVQDRPVKVYEPFASRFFTGRTYDVSSTGMCLEFPAWVALRPGRVINVHVGVRADGQPLANRRSMIPARVVWLSLENAPHLVTDDAVTSHDTASEATTKTSAKSTAQTTVMSTSVTIKETMKVGVEFLSGVKASAA